MKLNNRGWGLGVFLGFLVLLIGFIIVAMINAYNFDNNNNSSNNYFDYEVSQ